MVEGLANGDPEVIGGWWLLGRLGMGGQGVVYLGQSADGAKAAVKVLHAQLSADPTSRRRLAAELVAVQKVAAFCTARVLAADVEGDRPYIVSEYVAGPSLAQVVAADGPRRGPTLMRLAIGTATALTAIHQAEVIHRDFKPGNVLLGRDGPRVIDFGIAKVLDLATSVSAEIIGTPSFMAPEQLSGERLSAKLDVFAWGCTMVYAATGSAPFGHDALPVIMNRILSAPPELGALDGDLRRIVAGCLDKVPANRPSAREVLLGLLEQSSASGEPLAAGAELAVPPGEVTIVPPPLPAAEPPKLGRRRALAVLAGGTLLAGGTALALRGPKSDAGSGTASGTASRSAVSTPRSTPTVAVVRLPGIRGSLQLAPSSPLTMIAYMPIFGGRIGDFYVLDGSTYRRTPYLAAALSPDRRYLAGLSRQVGDFQSGNRLTIEDRATGTKHAVALDQPALNPRWSPRSNRLVVTLLDANAMTESTGFAIVTPGDYTAKVVTLSEAHVGSNGWPLQPGAFSWTAQENLVANLSSANWGDKTVCVYRPDGTQLTILPHLGSVVGDPFSPDGKLIALQTRFAGAEGKGGRDQVTLYDADGTYVRDLPRNLWFLGWYDSTHVIGYHWSSSGQVKLIGVDGTVGRVLITNEEEGDWNIWPYFGPSS
ncbi:protein kinase domain-containing protein [Nonomuraea jabiensis]|uniref:protein kinase domain-containing protein n=1 Tax=Nonomuraea jabiensis TaxID=882448 RepID=UPI00367D8EFD